MIVGHGGSVGDGDLNPPSAASKLGQFHSTYFACVFRKRHEKPLVSCIQCICQENKRPDTRVNVVDSISHE